MNKAIRLTLAALLITVFVITSFPLLSAEAASNESINSVEAHDQSNMNIAIFAALEGPEVKKLEVLGHEFNVKPASIFTKDQVTVVNGQISHHLRWRPDDQLYYRIEIENNEVKKVDIKIDRGGWTSLAAPLFATLAENNDVPVTLEMLEEFGRKMGRLIDGKWENAAEAIVSNIALHAK